jgi:hypothetical protein
MKPRGFPQVTLDTRVIDEGDQPLRPIQRCQGRDYRESRALYIVAELVREYPGIENMSLRGAMSKVIRQVAIELGRG